MLEEVLNEGEAGSPILVQRARNAALFWPRLYTYRV